MCARQRYWVPRKTRPVLPSPPITSRKYGITPYAMMQSAAVLRIAVQGEQGEEDPVVRTVITRRLEELARATAQKDGLVGGVAHRCML